MSLRWNPDGKGKRSYPPHLLTFGREKRHEFFKAYALSGWIGWGMGLGLTYYSTNGDANTGQLMFMCYQGTAMASTLLVALFGMGFALLKGWRWVHGKWQQL